MKNTENRFHVYIILCALALISATAFFTRYITVNQLDPNGCRTNEETRLRPAACEFFHESIHGSIGGLNGGRLYWPEDWADLPVNASLEIFKIDASKLYLIIDHREASDQKSVYEKAEEYSKEANSPGMERLEHFFHDTRRKTWTEWACSQDNLRAFLILGGYISISENFQRPNSITLPNGKTDDATISDTFSIDDCYLADNEISDDSIRIFGTIGRLK